jgi:hypothetical protein
MTVIATYTFGAEFVPDADVKIAKVNARCERNGIAIYATTVERFTETNEKTGETFDLVNYSVVGSAPKIAGWEFLARIDTDSLGVTTTNVVPGAVYMRLDILERKISRNGRDL